MAPGRGVTPSSGRGPFLDGGPFDAPRSSTFEAALRLVSCFRAQNVMPVSDSIAIIATFAFASAGVANSSSRRVLRHSRRAGGSFGGCACAFVASRSGVSPWAAADPSSAGGASSLGGGGRRPWIWRRRAASGDGLASSAGSHRDSAPSAVGEPSRRRRIFGSAVRGPRRESPVAAAGRSWRAGLGFGGAGRRRARRARRRRPAAEGTAGRRTRGRGPSGTRTLERDR